MSFNQMNDDGTAEPRPCANKCGFFGNATTMNLCSKCFKAAMITANQQISPKTTTSSSEYSSCTSTTGHEAASFSRTTELLTTSSTSTAPANRCRSCNRKVGMAGGFVCKCGRTFCGAHRHPEEHACEFDFKRAGRDAIAKANPVVKADKITRF